MSRGFGKGKLTHGRHADQRRANTGIQPPREAILRDALGHHIHGALVHAGLSGLQPDLDEVEGMADDDGADAAEAAGGQGAQAGERLRGRDLDVGFQLGLGLGDVRDVDGEGVEGLVDLGGGVGGGHCDGMWWAVGGEADEWMGKTTVEMLLLVMMIATTT